MTISDRAREQFRAAFDDEGICDFGMLICISMREGLALTRQQLLDLSGEIEQQIIQEQQYRRWLTQWLNIWPPESRARIFQIATSHPQ